MNNKLPLSSYSNKNNNVHACQFNIFFFSLDFLLNEKLNYNLKHKSMLNKILGKQKNWNEKMPSGITPVIEKHLEVSQLAKTEEKHSSYG